MARQTFSEVSYVWLKAHSFLFIDEPDSLGSVGSLDLLAGNVGPPPPPPDPGFCIHFLWGFMGKALLHWVSSGRCTGSPTMMGARWGNACWDERIVPTLLHTIWSATRLMNTLYRMCKKKHHGERLKELDFCFASLVTWRIKETKFTVLVLWFRLFFTWTFPTEAEARRR